MREGSNVKQVFQKNQQRKPYIGSMMKYHEVKDSGYYQHIIFVEGSSDRRFYMNTGDKRLSEHSYYIFSVRDKNADPDEEPVGKKAVISAFKDISKNTYLKDGLYKCLFIVDQDWDNQPLKNLMITKGHSMENYFLLEENLKILFLRFGKTSSDFDAFWQQYKQFSIETAEFWALKATVVYAYQNGHKFNYKSNLKFEQIFDFHADSKGHMHYQTQMMDQEIRAMQKGISQNKFLIGYCKRMCEKIKADRSLVRGHDAFRYLQIFFKECYELELDLYAKDTRLLNECIRQFQVEFDM